MITRPECLESFLPVVSNWFLEHIGSPSEPQKKGWPAISRGENVLLCAPTGSGKTLAAFLKCLDILYRSKKPEQKNQGIRIVYVSPLKALNNDIYRNLELPVRGIEAKATEMGICVPEIKIAVRTGDTQQKDRRSMLKNPPDILITTPESLFIMLTSKSYRSLFCTTEYLIVDEIHSLCPGKRGVHFAVTMERLERISRMGLHRVGLSATINPLDEVAGFLVGCRPDKAYDVNIALSLRNVTIINCDYHRRLDLVVNTPVKNLKAIPGGTIWTSIYSQLLTLIKSHKSTLVFVNNRRLAEQVTAGINILADEQVARTHHGSISMEMRQEVEGLLKEGKIPCLVATSSLEMGIDVGSIELVVQVGAPDSPSQALQRIGRSGHRLDAVSKGCIIPKTRLDLLNSAFVAFEALKRNIEKVKMPENCLDILAQQITSIACEGDIGTVELYSMIRGAYPYRNLPFKQFDETVNMLAFPSPENEPDLLKPRILLDRISGIVKGNNLGRMMCLSDGGTIPDRGNYTACLIGTGTKIGELEEEYVFESRIGDRFFLGNLVWRIEAIEHDRVLVSPSNASGGDIPFWKGDKTLRSFDTGMKYGAFLRSLYEEYNKSDFHSWAYENFRFDRTAADNLKLYIADQLRATGYLHNDRIVVCEYFSDETGEKRVIVHTPFGGSIHAVMAVILHSRLVAMLNCQIEYIYNNDGILFHFLGYNGEITSIMSLLDREGLEEEIMEKLPETPLFNMGLRYNLGRSLLLNSKRFGKRKPLWIQRLRSAELSRSLAAITDHPVVIETYRELLNDILDIKNLYKIIDSIKNGLIDVIDVKTPKPSPFSSELIFNFWQAYQYVGDMPMAEKRNQLLVTDREFIQLASGVEAEYELIDERAIDHVVLQLQKIKQNRKIRNADELYYYIYTFGGIPAEPYSSSSIEGLDEESLTSYLDILEDEARVLRFKIKKTDSAYWIAAEDFPVYCKAFGLDLSEQCFIVGKPGFEKKVKSSEWLNSYIITLDVSQLEAVQRIVRRHIRYNGPFCIKDLTDIFEFSPIVIKKVLDKLCEVGEVILLRQSDKAEDVIYCNVRVYESIKRKTLELARKDMEPKDEKTYCSFLLDYHGIGEHVLPPEDKLEKVIRQLQGMYLPAPWWEDFIFPSRVKGYEPRLLDYSCATGTVSWVARKSGNTYEVAFFMQDEFEGVEKALGDEQPEEELEDKHREVLLDIRRHGACFLKDISKRTGVMPGELLDRLEILVWNGFITNDSFSVVRFYLDNEKKNSLMQKHKAYPSMGRWSEIEKTGREQIRIQQYILRMLNRYGIMSKDVLAAEKSSFKWGEVYSFLKANEFGSGIKRGLYVSGLTSIQFARDMDLEKLRTKENSDEKWVTLCSCDPANPYRVFFSKVLPVKILKNQGWAVVFKNGKPVLIIKEFGAAIIPLDTELECLKKALQCFLLTYNNKMLWVSRKNIYTEKWDEIDIEVSPVYEFLLEQGYDKGYKGMTFWRKLN